MARIRRGLVIINWVFVLYFEFWPVNFSQLIMPSERNSIPTTILFVWPASSSKIIYAFPIFHPRTFQFKSAQKYVSKRMKTTSKAQNPSIPLFQLKHPPMPPISPRQPSPHPPCNLKSNLHSRMRLMELDTPFHVQFRRRKLPDGTIKLLCSKSSTSHGAEEIYPRNFSRCLGLAGCEE